MLDNIASIEQNNPGIMYLIGRKSRHLLWLFLSCPMFGHAAQANSSATDAFADIFSRTLLKVVAASDNGFRDIKGPQDPASNGEAWFSILPLPTARQCVVWIYRDRSLGRQYSCDFGRTFDLNEAQTAYTRALNVMNQTLREWSRSENSRSNSKTVSKVVFHQPSSATSVTLRLTNHGVHGYLLYVDVSPRD
jgi:hypothetical protein